jgi:hypothetical protein
MAMKIEVLYVPGCPNYQPALERVRAALAAEAVQGEIQRVAVTTVAEANALLFPGSPTIRINGEDAEPSPVLIAGLACRFYVNGSGVPSEQSLRAAISQAKRKE